MAFVIDAIGNSVGTDQGSGARTFTTSFTVGALANLVVLLCNIYENVTRIQLTNSSGASFTQIGSTVIYNSTRQSSIWYMASPPTGAFPNLYVTSTYALGSIGCVSFVGATGATFGTPTTDNTGSAGSWNIPCAPSDVVVDAYAIYSGDGAVTGGLSQTTIYNDSNNVTPGSGVCIASSYRTVATGTSVTNTWTNTGASAYMGVAIIPASAPSGGLDEDYEPRTSGLLMPKDTYDAAVIFARQKKWDKLRRAA